MLELAAETNPVAGNYQGSYLTFRSRPGAIFAVQVRALVFLRNEKELTLAYTVDHHWFVN